MVHSCPQCGAKLRYDGRTPKLKDKYYCSNCKRAYVAKAKTGHESLSLYNPDDIDIPGL